MEGKKIFVNQLFHYEDFNDKKCSSPFGAYLSKGSDFYLLY